MRFGKEVKGRKEKRMKPLACKVKYRFKYANLDDLVILVDEFPQGEYLYNTKDVNNSRLYFSEQDGSVRFYTASLNPDGTPKDDEGFGGREFKLRHMLGHDMIIRGPWSSRSGVMNQHFRKSMEVSMTDDPKAYERGYTLYGGKVTVEFAMDSIKLVKNEEIEIFPVYRGGKEIIYIPVKMDNVCHNHWKVEVKQGHRCVYCNHICYQVIEKGIDEITGMQFMTTIDDYNRYHKKGK